jgi:hypothetical protein
VRHYHHCHCFSETALNNFSPSAGQWHAAAASIAPAGCNCKLSREETLAGYSPQDRVSTTMIIRKAIAGAEGEGVAILSRLLLQTTTGCDVGLHAAINQDNPTLN